MLEFAMMIVQTRISLLSQSLCEGFSRRLAERTETA